MEVNQYFFELAKISSSKAAEQGIFIDPKWIYVQWYVETAGFTSDIQANHHNLGGITSSTGGWMHFNSFVDFANYFGTYLTYYSEDGLSGCVDSLYCYLQALHHGGYFSVDLNTYYQVMLQVLNTTSF